MSEHFTLDELAELDEGLLAGRRRRAKAAERHLGECDECAARADALHKTTDSLRNLGPVAMPADVATRLDRALRNVDAVSGTDVVPDLADVRTRRFGGIPPWAYAAAAAVVVLAGVGIGIGTTRHHNKAAETAGATKAPLVATATSSPQFLEQESGQTYTPSTLAQAAPGLLSDATRFDSLSSGPNTAAGPETAGGTASGGGTAPHGTAPRGAAGAQQAPALPAPALAPKSVPAVAPSLQRLAASRSALLHCAEYISDTVNAAPLAVDFGRWTNAKAHLRNVPAVVFVFADIGDAHAIDVYVVAAACDASSLLDFQVLNNAR